MANFGICSVENCGKIARKRELCQAHYARLRRYGDPAGGSTSLGAPKDFFFEVALKYDLEKCMDWPFEITKHGYGVIKLDGKRTIVSRLVCMFIYGDPPTEKHEAAHSCGNRKCVNPRHLRWATSRENHADELIHGTRPRGNRNGQAKLSKSDVLHIKTLCKTKPSSEIAMQYNVSPNTINDIKSGRTWSWLK